MSEVKANDTTSIIIFCFTMSLRYIEKMFTFSVPTIPCSFTYFVIDELISFSIALVAKYRSVLFALSSLILH